jgi:hypothetical protein
MCSLAAGALQVPWHAWAWRPCLCYACFAVLYRWRGIPFRVCAGGLSEPCLFWIVSCVVVAFLCSGWFVFLRGFLRLCCALYMCCWVGSVPCVRLSVFCLLFCHFLPFPSASLCNTIDSAGHLLRRQVHMYVCLIPGLCNPYNRLHWQFFPCQCKSTLPEHIRLIMTISLRPTALFTLNKRSMRSWCRTFVAHEAFTNAIHGGSVTLQYLASLPSQ